MEFCSLLCEYLDSFPATSIPVFLWLFNFIAGFIQSLLYLIRSFFNLILRLFEGLPQQIPLHFLHGL